jgi:CubicO group peptidase (beta-lactamase class C family)
MMRWSAVRAGLLVVASLPLVSPAAVLGDAISAEELSSRAEEYMAARVKRDKFSGSILVARAGKTLYCKAFGMANLELDVPCTPSTKFRLASLTKQFTAMAILILQEQHKLKVTDTLKAHLKDAPKAWDDVTIHHLLTHTSGIPSYTDFPDFQKTLPDPITLSELIAKFKSKPLEFKPGERFKYSNSGYILLGKLIETASGKPYATYMKEAIFDPLKMRDTGYDSGKAILKNRAAGYSRLLGVVLTNADYIDMSIPHAAGALYSTVEDLLKWDQALEAGKLVSAKSITAMFTPFKGDYAYGWSIDKKFGQIRQQHGGGIMGFATMIARYPSDKLLVVVLSNLEGSPVGPICNDLAAIALVGPYVVPRDPKAIALEPKVYEALVGVYVAELPDGKGTEQIAVTYERGRLMFQAKGKAKVEAVPEAERRFYIKLGDSTAEFINGPAGIATRLVLLQNNVRLNALRVPPKAQTRAPASPEAAPAGARPRRASGHATANRTAPRDLRASELSS